MNINVRMQTAGMPADTVRTAAGKTGEAPGEGAASLPPRDTVELSKRQGSASPARDGEPSYVPGQVLVKLKPGITAAAVRAFADRGGMQVMHRFDVPAEIAAKLGGDLYQLRLGPADTVERAIERLAGQPGVAYAEPNYVVRLDDDSLDKGAPEPGVRAAKTAPAGAEKLPNDLDHNLWNLRNTGEFDGVPGVDIGAARAWTMETGKPSGQGPLVAVIDTGIDYMHPDLAANMWNNPRPGEYGYPGDLHGANMFKKNGDCMDDNEHGTHAAGTIGAVGNNGVGVVGLNWNATLVGIKALSQWGAGDVAHIVDAVLYATKIGARVTSNSYAAAGFSQTLYDAMKASPALHVCAAGNSAQDNDQLPSYPASFRLPNVIAVAAHDRNDRMPHFSNYGAKTVHLAAPGQSIYSTTPKNTYSQRSGTSMATPHVAGVVALLASHFPGITNEQIVRRLMDTVVKAPAYEGKTISGGRVNAAAALG